MKKTAFIILAVALLATGCGKPEQEPEFRRIDNIRVNKVTGKEARLSAEAIFYNPNDVRMNLKSIDVDIQLDGKTIGSVNETMKSKIPALAEFKIPMDVRFDMKEIGLLNGIVAILGGKPLAVTYIGSIRVSVYGITYNVPVEFEDSVKL